MKKCIIIRSNDLDRDTRVPKLATALSDKYKVSFLGWNREGNRGVSITKITLPEQHMFNMRAPFGKKVLLFLPFWWLFILTWLLRNEWDVVHVINFDSAVPAIVASKIKSKKVIYEILDTYEDSTVFPGWIRGLLIVIDKFFISKSDAIILADDEQIQEFGGIPNRTVIAVYDSPPDLLQRRNDRMIDRSTLQIFYAGVLFRDRRLNVDKMIEAVADLENVKLIIAGYGDLVDTIKDFEEKMPNKIQYIGKLSYEDALEKLSSSDLGFVLREPIVPINKYICGSTLLNAMMCGKPLIVNKGTSTAKKVLDANCGIVVDANNVEEIRKALILLRENPELREQLGNNARIAYEENYSLDQMNNKLTTLYENVIRSG